MLYLYDNALADDLTDSLSGGPIGNTKVKVVDEEAIIDVIAQMKEDNIEFPFVSLTRDNDTPLDTERMNFTRMHRGVVSVIDPETNLLYYEKAVPIKLSYTLSVLTTNTADMDELIKELIFKYTSMYFVSFTLPYECKRKVRFGVRIDPDESISKSSGLYDYISGGKLYEASIPLKCEGCVLVAYTPAKMQRGIIEVEPTLEKNLK